MLKEKKYYLVICKPVAAFLVIANFLS